MDMAQAYYDGIQATTRRFSVRGVLSYGETTFEFTGDDIEGFKLLDEVKSDGDKPLGHVSANEIEIRFNNYDKRFDPDNEESEFYELINLGAELEVELGCMGVPFNDFLYAPLGKFYASNFIPDHESGTMTVLARDVVGKLLNMPVPRLPVQTGVTTGQLFSILFDTLGFEDYEIDPRAVQYIRLTFFAEEEMHKVLNNLCEASGCFLYSRYDGTLVVQSVLDNFEEATREITGDGLMFSKGVPLDIENVYDTARIGYRPLYQKLEAEQVLEIGNLTLEVGGNVFKDVAITATPPLTQITQFLMDFPSEADVVVDWVDFTATTVSFSITNNESSNVSVNVSVMGKLADGGTQAVNLAYMGSLRQVFPQGLSYHTLVNTQSDVEKFLVQSDFAKLNVGVTKDGDNLNVSVDNSGESGEAIVRIFGIVPEDVAVRDKQYRLFNPFIQTRQTALVTGVTLLRYLSNRTRAVTLDYRGDPSIKLYEKINVESDVFEADNILVLRHELEFDGTLSGKIHGVRV